MRRALAIGTVAMALGATSAYAGDPVRIGFVGTSLASVPIVVAAAKGFFAAQGLDTKLMPFESSLPSALAIASGDADFGTTGLSEPFFVLGHQGSLKIIGGDRVEHQGFPGLGFADLQRMLDWYEARGLQKSTSMRRH